MRPAGSQISDRCQRLGVLLAEPRGFGHGLRRLVFLPPTLRCEAFTRFRKPTPSIFRYVAYLQLIDARAEGMLQEFVSSTFLFRASSLVFRWTALPASGFLTA